MSKSNSENVVLDYSVAGNISIGDKLRIKYNGKWRLVVVVRVFEGPSGDCIVTQSALHTVNNPYRTFTLSKCEFIGKIVNFNPSSWEHLDE